MSNIVECVAGVAEFNVIAGNYDNIGYEKILAQAKVVREEGLELFAAVNDLEGDEAILKETIDVLVVAHGFAGMLANAGYDVYGAWKEINDNNLNKFPSSQTDAFYTKVGYESTGIPVEVSQYCSNVWVVKDLEGKVRKPIGYVPVDLTKFLPQQKENT